MNGGEPSVWSVVSVSAPDLARTERGPAAVQHAEWVRLFLGRALAPARLVGQEHAPSAVEYLISGIEVSGSLHRDDAACIEAASAVATDFEGLRDVIAYHRDRIERCAQDPNNVPLELFLTTYPMLMCVTVSDDPADWRVTDQGLCIVRWGLRGPRHRPLLQWSAQELQALQRRVIAAAGLPDVAPGEASYSRVAKSAWKVIKDDDEQQRVQKVGDRAKGTGVNTQVASGTPDPNSPMPVPRRASWLAWAETGLVVLALAAAGAGWWMDHWSLSETRDNLNKELRARESALSEAKAGRETAENAKESLQSQLTACRADGEAAGPSLAEARLNAQLAVRRASALEGRLTDLESLKNQLEKEKNGALVESNRLQIELTNLQQQLTAAQTRGERAGDQIVPVSGDPTAPVNPSANGSAPKSGTPPVPAQVDPLPAPSKDSNVDSTLKGSGGPEAGEVTGAAGRGENAGTSGGSVGGTSNLDGAESAGDARGAANPLELLLEKLCGLYMSAAGSTPQTFQEGLVTRGNGLDQQQLELLRQRVGPAYLQAVSNCVRETRTDDLFVQGSVELSANFCATLTKQVNEFAKGNALVKVALSGSTQRINDKINEGGWYWITLGDASPLPNVPNLTIDKNLDALTKRFEKCQTSWEFSSGNKEKGKWSRFVTDLAVYCDGRFPSGCTGKMYAISSEDAPPNLKWNDPQAVAGLAWPPRADRGKPTLDDLVELLRSVVKRVDLQGPYEDVGGKKKPRDVSIPVSVARDFIGSVLSNPLAISKTEVVNSSFGHLAAVLDKQEGNGQPRDDVANMQRFKGLLQHPPYFPTGSKIAGKIRFYGALFLSGGYVKVVLPAGVTDSNLTGDLAAFDGSQFRHIGYLEEGKQTFDPGEYEDLLGCAVFVVEPKQKQSPSK